MFVESFGFDFGFCVYFLLVVVVFCCLIAWALGSVKSLSEKVRGFLFSNIMQPWIGSSVK